MCRGKGEKSKREREREKVTLCIEEENIQNEADLFEEEIMGSCRKWMEFFVPRIKAPWITIGKIEVLEELCRQIPLSRL